MRVYVNIVYCDEHV